MNCNTFKTRKTSETRERWTGPASSCGGDHLGSPGSHANGSPGPTNANTHRDCDISADGLSIVFTEFVSPRIEVMFSERATRTSPWAPPIVWSEFSTVGTSLGVYSFTRSLATDEAFLAAGFTAAAGGQEILRTTRVPALAVPYGAGCAGTAALVPAIGANGSPRLGNAGFAFTLGNALPSSVAVLFAGFAPDNVAIGPVATKP